MDTHLKLHATQLKQLTQTQTHPLHDLNAYLNPPRNMKATVFHNNEHTNITSQYLSSIKNNIVTYTTPYDIHSSEQTLPCHIHTKLVQLKANKSPLTTYNES